MKHGCIQECVFHLLLRQPCIMPLSSGTAGLPLIDATSVAAINWSFSGFMSLCYFHLFGGKKVEPKSRHDQSPGGSATTQALRTGTPTTRPALIVDARARILTQASAREHARASKHAQASTLKQARASMWARAIMREYAGPGWLCHSGRGSARPGVSQRTALFRIRFIKCTFHLLLRHPSIIPPSSGTAGIHSIKATSVAQVKWFFSGFMSIGSFHLFGGKKVEPKSRHDQSPGGSATTQALRTGTPTTRPALIVDARARILTQASAREHARASKHAQASALKQARASKWARAIMREHGREHAGSGWLCHSGRGSARPGISPSTAP